MKLTSTVMLSSHQNQPLGHAGGMNPWTMEAEKKYPGMPGNMTCLYIWKWDWGEACKAPRNERQGTQKTQ